MMWKDSWPAAARPLMEFVAYNVSRSLYKLVPLTYDEHVDALCTRSNDISDQTKNGRGNEKPTAPEDIR
jgi:hypothetical protein